MSQSNSVKILKKLTGKKHIFFTDRGNSSILLALKLAKSLGKKKVFIQDQGGWFTYRQYIIKLKLELNYLKTDFGIIGISDLRLDRDSVLLINSMPGYFALQNMKQIFNLCKKRDAFLINDVSGSIGTEEAKYGLAIGSFGRWKPINIEYGGFIAYDEDYNEFFRENFNKKVKDFFEELSIKLKTINSRLKKFQQISSKIKKQLKEYEIIHGTGINVVVRIHNAQQKLNIIDYCNYNGYEYVVCPKYIRVLTDAVSIEVKRLEV